MRSSYGTFTELKASRKCIRRPRYLDGDSSFCIRWLAVASIGVYVRRRWLSGIDEYVFVSSTEPILPNTIAQQSIQLSSNNWQRQKKRRSAVSGNVGSGRNWKPFSSVVDEAKREMQTGEIQEQKAVFRGAPTILHDRTNENEGPTGKSEL